MLGVGANTEGFWTVGVSRTGGMACSVLVPGLRIGCWVVGLVGLVAAATAVVVGGGVLGGALGGVGLVFLVWTGIVVFKFKNNIPIR